MYGSLIQVDLTNSGKFYSTIIYHKDNPIVIQNRDELSEFLGKAQTII